VSIEAILDAIGAQLLTEYESIEQLVARIEEIENNENN